MVKMIKTAATLIFALLATLINNHAVVAVREQEVNELSQNQQLARNRGTVEGSPQPRRPSDYDVIVDDHEGPLFARSCSSKQVSGRSFGFLGKATYNMTQSKPWLNLGQVSFVRTGSMKFYGDGTCYGTFYTTYGFGQQTDTTPICRYTIYPNCTMKLDAMTNSSTTKSQTTMNFIGVATDNGPQLLHLESWSRGVYDLNIQPLECSNSSLKGSYGNAGFGIGVNANQGSGFSTVAAFSFDGKGKFEGSRIAIMDSIEKDEFSGSYSVSKDCWITMYLNSTKPTTARGVLIENGFVAVRDSTEYLQAITARRMSGRISRKGGRDDDD